MGKEDDKRGSMVRPLEHKKLKEQDYDSNSRRYSAVMKE